MNKKKLTNIQRFKLLVKKHQNQQADPRPDSTELKPKDEDAGSRKRIYRLTRCESVKVQNRLSQGLSQ